MDTRATAQQGLDLLKRAILETIRQNPEGITNAQLADALDIRSDYAGGQKDYLSWSILGLLLNEGKIQRSGTGRAVRYSLKAG